MRSGLPITRTLKNPKIDGEALKEYWKRVGIDLLGNSMEAGINGLERLLQGMRMPRLRGLIPPARQAGPPAAPPQQRRCVKERTPVSGALCGGLIMV